MPSETDSHGRLYLRAALRERYGEKFHIVEYDDRLELIPVEEDAIEAARQAAGSAFDGSSVDPESEAE